MNARNIRLLIGTLVSLALPACLSVESKTPPVAKIEVKKGDKVLNLADPIPLDGSSIKLTLDGSGSTDADGEIIAYKWMRTDVPASVRYDAGASDDDAGTAAAVPRFTGDPDPKEVVEITLRSAGKYRYSLWVTDNAELVSAPASVTLNVTAP